MSMQNKDFLAGFVAATMAPTVPTMGARGT